MGNRHPCPPAPSSSPSSSPASDDAPAPTTTSPPSPRPLPPNFVPLLGHTTLDAHEDAVRAALAIAARRSDLGGEEGLRELGFEFRSVPCIEHRAEEAEAADDGDEGADEGCDEGGGSSSTDEGEEAPPRSPDVLPPPNDRSDPSPNSTASNESVATRSTSALSLWSDCVGESNDRFSGGSACCPRCATRLFYVGRSAAPSDADGRPAASKPPVRSIPREGSREEDRGEEAAGFDEPTTDSERRRRRGEERPGQRQQQESEQPQRLEDGPEAVMITDDNRRRYIADGAMYELVATLAQEAAQSILCKTFDLVWVTVCDERHLGERVRAMVDRDHGSLLEEDETLRVASELVCGRDHDDHADEKKEEGDDDEADRRRRTEPPASADEAESTLLVATGRGKVRAGIFSRRHLLTAGIETGTSWRCVREARARKWGVAIVDPNARGEGAGYDTFRRSVRRLFPGGASGGGGGRRGGRRGACGSFGGAGPGAAARERRPRRRIVPDRRPWHLRPRPLRLGGAARPAPPRGPDDLALPPRRGLHGLHPQRPVVQAPSRVAAIPPRRELRLPPEQRRPIQPELRQGQQPGQGRHVSLRRVRRLEGFRDGRGDGRVLATSVRDGEDGVGGHGRSLAEQLGGTRKHLGSLRRAGERRGRRRRVTEGGERRS
ncbi:hypothetical protein ACHAWF_015479 [Thalassiosira exigua]